MLIEFTILQILSIAVFSKFSTVVIVTTNDIHGSAFPTFLYRTDTGENYTYGGLEVMAQMIQTIREEYGGNMIYLDAGDQFQGGI
jgi:2',3'-cyclic-nucleotide 2'-phosphodiesterase (5'-nucleotidase family)